MSEYIENAKFKLDETKYYYEQMKLNFQDRTKFLFSLDAFLSAARAVTFVFQNTRNKVDESVMKWYNEVTDVWKKEKVMRLLVEMRNVSIKEHTPQMQTTAAAHMLLDVIIADSLSIKKVSPDGKVEERTTSPHETTQQSEVKPQAPAAPTIISRSFHELPEWFDQDSDVMHLCEEWLGKLESFIAEAERMVNVAQAKFPKNP
jgi:hypothetical protein